MILSAQVFTQDSYVLHRGLAKGLFPYLFTLEGRGSTVAWQASWLLLILKLFSWWVSKQRSDPFPTSPVCSHSHTTTSQNARHIKQDCAGLALLTPSKEDPRAGKGRQWEYSEKQAGQWDRTAALDHQLGSAIDETSPCVCLCPASTCLTRICEYLPCRTPQDC